MKTNSSQNRNPEAGNPSSNPEREQKSELVLQPGEDWLAAPAAGRVRILLGIDVPVEALPAIQADWERVTTAQEKAPEFTATAVATALRRLQQHAEAVAGVAVLELRENPLAAWLRREATPEAA